MLGCIIARKKYKVTAKFNGISEVFNELKDGWPLFISNAMGSIFGSIGVTILSFMSANYVVGIYSAVSKIPYALNLLFWAASQALYPRSCKAFSTSFDTGLKFVKKYSLPVIIFFSICGFVIVLFRDIIVKISFGGEYIQGSGLLFPFIIWSILGIINNFLGIQTLVASGYQSEYSRAFTISMGVMLVLMVLLGHIWSAFGIAWASMCSELLLTTLLIGYIQRIRKRNKTINDAMVK